MKNAIISVWDKTGIVELADFLISKGVRIYSTGGTKKTLEENGYDIDAHLKNKDVDEIKELCEKMYHDGKIGRTGNYRYFILTEQKKKTKSKKASAPKSEEVDVKAELKKFKEMLDDGLIEQEDYDAKKKELLGL